MQPAASSGAPTVTHDGIRRPRALTAEPAGIRDGSKGVQRTRGSAKENLDAIKMLGVPRGPAGQTAHNATGPDRR